MTLTRDFMESIKQKADSDPDFRKEMLTNAISEFLNGDAVLAQILLRDYVNATIGFTGLSKAIGKHGPEPLRSMLSARGNPVSSNLSDIIQALLKHEGVNIKVTWGESCSK